jgi:hypothetical protein
MSSSTKRGSVQQQVVELRGVQGPLLHLESAGKASYASVLEIGGISYDLKGEAEQQQLLALYHRFVCSLSFPVQLLWRILPLDLHAYLKPFLSAEQTTPSHGKESLWEDLAASHVAFVQQVGARRTLLARQMFLIMRLDDAPQRLPQPRWWPGKRRQHVEAMAREQARPLLDLRVGEVTRLLEALGLTVRRLSGPEELVSFYASCLAPGRMQRYPLHPERITGIGRPVLSTEQVVTSHAFTPADSAQVAVSKEPANRQPSRASGRKASVALSLEERLDLARIEDLVAPAAIAVAPDLLKIEEEYARVITVHQLPRVVSAGWLKALMDLDEPMEVSFHLQPLDSATMVRQLRRRLTEYQSSRLTAQRQGQTLDPHVKLAETDVATLMDRLASGEERMLSLSMHLLVRASSKRGLEERTERVLSVLHSLLLGARLALFEQEQGFRSVLPHGRNHLGTGILLDSRAASTMLPFLSGGLFHPDGILEGITPAGDPVVLDPWHEQISNANRIILGPPGWGKSYRVKASLIRMALKSTLPRLRQGMSTQAFQVIVIDPEREYARVAEALEGQVVRLAPGSPHHLNPFDLPPLAADDQREPQHGDRLADQLQVLHALLEIMLADRTPEGGQTLTSTEKGLLDRALFETYRRVGITSDVRTHQRPAPLLRDLYAVLESGVCGPDPTGLTQRLRRYVTGSLSGLFAGPTNVNVRGEVIVFDVHDLETELRPVGLFLVSNFVWKESFQSRIPRQLIVDEAATLYQYSSGARFLEDLVRRARKYYLGVTVISQHPLLFRDSSILANCAVQILLRQDATALDLIGQMFKLSAREIQVVRRLGVGEALLLVGEQRMQVRCEVSPLEHQLATTNPRELAQWHAQTQPATASATAEQRQQVSTRAEQQEERHVAPVQSQLAGPLPATPLREGRDDTTQPFPHPFAFRRVHMQALPDMSGEGSLPDEA